MRRFAAPYVEPQPLWQMNITPLIDVMLVLLIIFILSVPAATHKVPLDLPGRGGIAAEFERHRMRIDAAGAVTIDGAQMSDAALPARLAALAASDTALLEIETAPEARYERFDSLLATIQKAGVTRLGFVGNERHARW